MSLLCRIVARHRRSALVRYAARKCRRLIECYENSRDYDFDRNGERQVLEALAGTDVRCVLDVGANVGEWAAMARAILPRATVHCFEVYEPTAAALRRRFADDPRVVVNAVGLSDAEARVSLSYHPDHPVLTNLLDLPHEFPSRREEGRVVTGDSYLEGHGIDHVDFAKIDVEGVEGRVLGGLARSLDRRAIEVIQFEYGTASIQTKFLLRDFYDLLAPRGYRIGKIYPTYVEFRDYDWRHEDFLGPNYLAVRGERADLLGRLGRS